MLRKSWSPRVLALPCVKTGGNLQLWEVMVLDCSWLHLGSCGVSARAVAAQIGVFSSSEVALCPSQ